MNRAEAGSEIGPDSSQMPQPLSRAGTFRGSYDRLWCTRPEPQLRRRRTLSAGLGLTPRSAALPRIDDAHVLSLPSRPPTTRVGGPPGGGSEVQPDMASVARKDTDHPEFVVLIRACLLG